MTQYFDGAVLTTQYWNKHLCPNQVHYTHELAAFIKDPLLWLDDRANLVALFDGLGLDVDDPGAGSDQIIPESLLAVCLREELEYAGKMPLDLESWVVVDWEATAQRAAESDSCCAKYRTGGNWFYSLKPNMQPFIESATTENLEN